MVRDWLACPAAGMAVAMHVVSKWKSAGMHPCHTLAGGADELSPWGGAERAVRFSIGLRQWLKAHLHPGGVRLVLQARPPYETERKVHYLRWASLAYENEIVLDLGL